MAGLPITPPRKDTPRESARKQPGWGFALAVLGLIAAIGVAVAVQTRGPRDPYRQHDPLEGADQRELRQVAQAVSVIIRTPDGQSEPAVAALEALRPETPGAADLREACVTTYRGLLDLTGMQPRLHALDPRDGGAPPTVTAIAEASATLQRAIQIEHAVRDSKDRCLTLYQAACDTLGILPAQRSRADVQGASQDASRGR